MLADQGRLRQRLRAMSGAAGATESKRSSRALDEFERDLESSILRRRRRTEGRPIPRYDGTLPIHGHVDEIRNAIEREQVLVVCGETGSGKTTQLPFICLDAGRGVAGLIGHTQPRRIAARSVARRMAEELRTPLGGAVGYQVRFADETSAETYIKVMTDGILLAEIPRDRMLRTYDTLIIDEAHERSLNIDFLLGYVRTLVDKRRDLRVIITSATIDPDRFSRHFNNAPIIQVEGRTYPVEMRYRPLASAAADEPARDEASAILEAVDELSDEGPGDVLVFLPGERDIRDVARALRSRASTGMEILPLYSRLSLDQQAKVFQPHDGRRVVLATNVAETSITVPGIRYVIDPGSARISRYSARARVQRLPIEPVSQASANQRAGRCGRVQNGICIRLYDLDDFEKREPFTQPEILRSSLAGVILRMLALGLGDVSTFPFLEPPRRAMIDEGYETLHELGAINEQGQLTSVGRTLARLPIDPRLGRMLLVAMSTGALREVLVIVAGLSIHDPRERPADRLDAADRAHQIFADDTSDFMALLNLWNWYHERVREGPWSAVKRACADQFVSFIRMREWQDVHHQLRDACREIDPSARTSLNAPPSEFEAVHRALLAGLLSQIGRRDDRERGRYLGANATTFHIFPGSCLSRTTPRWVVGSEIIETKKRYAHGLARVRTDWIEEAADHLVKRTYAEPDWDKRHGWVSAKETVTLFGLPIVEGRPVHYGPIAPDEARTVFITRALVEEELRPFLPFLEHNRRLIREIEELEARHRRRNLLVDERVRWAYYDARLPRDICTLRQLQRWLKREHKRRPTLLCMTREELLEQANALPSKKEFPDHHDVGPARLRLTYHLEPGADDDGVTIHVPVEIMNQITPAPLQWLVPGMLEELIIGLIRTLPKTLRKSFVPAPDFAEGLVPLIRFGEGQLLDQLSHYLAEMTRVPVGLADFDPARLPDHLRMNIRIVGADEKVIAEGRDLLDVRRQAAAGRRDAPSAEIRAAMESDGLTSWTMGAVPRSVERSRAGTRVRGYPALVDCGETVAVRVLDTEEAAAASHRRGVTRLAAIAMHDEVRSMLEHVPGIDRVRLLAAARSDSLRFDEAFTRLVVDAAIHGDGDEIRDAATFDAALVRAGGALWAMAHDMIVTVESIYAGEHEVRIALESFSKPVWAPIVADIKRVLAALVPDDVLTITPPMWLAHLPRFLTGILRRLEKLPGGGHRRDERLQAEFEPYWQRWCAAEHDHAAVGLVDPALTEYRWMLEEYRIALFAQELGTSRVISTKRLEKQWLKVRHRPAAAG
jgi:ATP-dependent helicase HrpA